MEEVDSIILQFLRQLNIKIDDEVKSITDLSVQTIITSTSKFLSLINPNIKLPKNCSSSISNRIEIAAQIASACKDLGYKNDVGYQTFLYHNESELRQVFMFLIEQMPTEGKQATPTASFTSKKSQLLIDIANKINEELNTIWIPPCCNNYAKDNVGDNIPDVDSRNTDTTNQIINHIMETEDMLLEKLMKVKSATSHYEKPVTNKLDQYTEVHEENLQPVREKEQITETLKELKEKAIVLRQKLSGIEHDRAIMNAEYNQVQRILDKANNEYTNVQNILSNIGINIETDKIPENILEKVQKNIDKLHAKSEELTSANLAVKVEIDKVKASNEYSQVPHLEIEENRPCSSRGSERELLPERTKCKNILLSLRDTAKSMKEEYSLKEQQVEELKEKYEKLKTGSKRSIYTKRILEIIGNVDKQNLEIKKILDDIRQLQKEINSLEGQLDRCFSIADETLYGDAKRDDQAKKAYKLLALLHSECSTIITLVNDTGTLARDIIDLEDNIKTEQAKKTEDTLKKIQMDLKHLQEAT